MNIEQLEDELGIIVPGTYEAFLETAPKKNQVEFELDIDSVFKLNQYMHEGNDWELIESDMFFLRDDGCGNTFFVREGDKKEKVHLLAHDPEGIEDTKENLRDFLFPDLTRFV